MRSSHTTLTLSVNSGKSKVSFCKVFAGSAFAQKPETGFKNAPKGGNPVFLKEKL